MQNITKCNTYKQLEQEFDNITREKPQEYPPQLELQQIPQQESCTYEVRVGRECKTRVVGICFDYHGVYETRTNQECENKQLEERERIQRINEQLIQFRENEVQRIDQRNKDLKKRQDDLRLQIIEIEKTLLDCQQYIANYEP